MEPMYRGIPFSPQTTLTATIGAADTVIPVADVSAFPDPPNYATIGIDADGETISYAAKTDDALSGCTRGVEGTPKSWASGSVIARNFTAKDLDSLQKNLRKIVKGVQSSWSQNDPKEASYVEGRTHYLETFEAVEVISSQVAEFNGTATAYVTGIAAGMVEGEPYTVEWNGTEHKCTAKNIGGDIFVGNFSLVGTGGEDTGEPFCIYRFSGTNYMVHKETSASEVVSLAVGRPYTEVFHKLDGGYLLDGIPYAEHVDEVVLPECSYDSDGLGYVYGNYAWELHERWVYDVVWNGTLYRCPAVMQDGTLKLTQAYVDGTDLLMDAPFQQFYPPKDGPVKMPDGRWVCAALIGPYPYSGSVSITGYTMVNKLDPMSLPTQPNVFDVEFGFTDYADTLQALPDNDTAHLRCLAAEEAGKLIVAKYQGYRYNLVNHSSSSDWVFSRVAADKGSPVLEILYWDSNYQGVDDPAVTITSYPLGGGGASVEPAEDDIPKVYFTGTLPTSKEQEDVRLTMRYRSKTADFIYPVTLKVQGASSANYPKKNFTLKPYKDETYEKKQKLAFKNWPEMNKFVLKAHWIDHSHVRNVGTAKLWGKVVASRPDYNSLPEELRNSPNNGATDGFTVKVFANGVYQGLYEWIVAKDKLFGQDSDIATHSILNSEWNNQPTCAFATTSPTMSGNWSEELQDSMSTAISTSFANLIKFVAGSTDEEFVANAENYFDVQSVIDYNIFARIFCIVDNICRNQIFFTYDGVKWYEGVWDLDATLGLPPTVRGFYAYNTAFQAGYIAYTDYGVTNLLYRRVENLFLERFKARYAELRAGVLSADNIIDVYERLTDTITTYDGLLKEDYAATTGGGKFTGIPYTSENNIQQIRNFVAQRTAYMDGVVEAMSGESGGGSGGEEIVACTGISLSASTLTLDEGDVQTLVATVEPENTTDVVAWNSSNTSVATVVDGVITAVGGGECVITATCGEQNAACTIVVTAMESVNILDSVELESGLINGINGSNIASPDCVRTGYFDFSDYAGALVGVTTNNIPTVRFAAYDADKACVQAIYDNTDTKAELFFTVVDTAKYARFSVLIKNETTIKEDTVSLYATGSANILDAVTQDFGKYYDSVSGALTDNSLYNAKRIAVNAATCLFVNAESVVFQSEDGSVTGANTTVQYKDTLLRLPTGTKYVCVNYRADRSTSVWVRKAVEIGRRQINGNDW